MNWSGFKWKIIRLDLGTDDTTWTEVVEPSSFVAAGGRLLVHLINSYSTACPGDTQAPQKVQVFLWKSQNDWREMQLPRKRKPKDQSLKPDLISEFSRSGE